ncbi:MAG: class I SAM-dependent methyltransferase [Candidatus Methylacidiphilales bacterium]
MKTEAGHPELEAHLRHRISAEGPLCFSDFMQEALYHPQWGYYLSGDPHVGRYGDFYTNVSVSHLFGQLLGQQFEEMWRILGEPETFVIIEQGANTGQFAMDVLDWLSKWRPDLYQRCAYWFVEPFPPLRAKQEETLASHGHQQHVYWVDSVEQLEGAAATGIFFTNELVDSFPTHMVTYRQGVWKEQRVGLNQRNAFSWVLQDISDPLLLSHIQRWDLPRIEKYTTEINLKAGPWMEGVGRALDRGFVVTVDYGFPGHLLYHANRIDGTLTCYYQHRKSYDPLIRVGAQDITAHVNFDLLISSGESVGLRLEGLVDQHHFMVGVARHEYLAFQEAMVLENPNDPQVMSAARAFRTLMHPEMLGTSFKFLIQSKGLHSPVELMALKDPNQG